MFSRIYIPICLILLLLAGCRSDEPFGNNRVDEPTHLNVIVPSAVMARQTATRAGNEEHNDTYDILTQEALITTLDLYAFYTEGASRKSLHYKLSDYPGDEVQGIYRSYKLNVPEKSYDLYLLANVNPTTLAGKADGELETAVKNLALALPVSYAQKENADGLPMAGKTLNKEVKKGANEVKIELGFLCAKVRLTILNDKAFGEGNQPFGALTAKNLSQYTNVFVTPTNATASNLAASEEDQDLADFAKYYKLNETLTALGQNTGEDLVLSSLLNKDANGKQPIDKFTTAHQTTSQIDPGASFIYQTVCYPAENLGATESLRSLLELATSKANTSLDFKLGCDETSDWTYDRKKGGLHLRRSNFYDIVARVSAGGEIQVDYNVELWTPENVDVALAGLSELWVQKTRVDEITGQKSAAIPFRTNAPSVTITQPAEQKIGGQDVFSIKPDMDEGLLNVYVNPNLATNEKLYNQKFYVRAGNIVKEIVVAVVDPSDYFVIRPSSQIVYVDRLQNIPDGIHEVYFEYATNLDNPSIWISEYTNTNIDPETKKIRDFAERTEEGMKSYQGIYVELCDDEMNSISGIYKMSDLLLGSGETAGTNKLKPSSGSMPKTGYIRLTMADVSSEKYFSKSIDVTFSGQASKDGDVHPDKGVLEIIPMPTVYTIHFKAINSDDESFKWTDPHIYVYQPLMYNGMPIFEKDVNWVEYSFTGKVVFKGWKDQNGSVATPTRNANDGIEQNGIKVLGYNVSWGDPTKGDGYLERSDKYFLDLDMMSEHRKKDICGSCKTGNNPVWPGIGMEGPDANGWYSIDLPLTVKPGVALCMFADGHGGGKDNYRFPDDKVPGVAIPNYADKEAWYLLDVAMKYDGDFTDDRHEYYPGHEIDNTLHKVNFKWNSSDAKSHLYMWWGDTKLTGTWPGTLGSLSSGIRSVEANITGTALRHMNNFDGKVEFKFSNNGNDETGNYSFNSSNLYKQAVPDPGYEATFVLLQDNPDNLRKIGYIWKQGTAKTSDVLIVYNKNGGSNWYSLITDNTSWNWETKSHAIKYNNEDYYLTTIKYGDRDKVEGYSWKANVNYDPDNVTLQKVTTIPSSLNSYDLIELYIVTPK